MKIAGLVLLCVVGAIANDYGYGAAPVLKKSGYAAPVEVLKTKTDAYSGYSHQLKVSPIIPIVKYLKNDDHYGTYNFETESADGTIHQETGSLKQLNTKESEGPVNVKQGSYSWTSPEGQFFEVKYTSDENGFRASGAHLPTSPPIPIELKTFNSAPISAYAVPSYGY